MQIQVTVHMIIPGGGVSLLISSNGGVGGGEALCTATDAIVHNQSHMKVALCTRPSDIYLKPKERLTSFKQFDV